MQTLPCSLTKPDLSTQTFQQQHDTIFPHVEEAGYKVIDIPSIASSPGSLLKNGEEPGYKVIDIPSTASFPGSLLKNGEEPGYKARYEPVDIPGEGQDSMSTHDGSYTLLIQVMLVTGRWQMK